MQAINDLIISYLGPFGPLMLVGALGFMMVLLTLPVLLKKEEDPLDRLKSGKNTQTKEKAADLRASKGSNKLDRYADFLEPKNEEEFSAVRLKLTQAGYQSKTAVRFYYFAQFSLGVLGLVLGGIYTFIQMQNGDVSTNDMLLTGLGPAVAGYMGPKYWVTKRQGKRQEAITNGFPDSLDMLLVCVEAGQSFDQAIRRVSGELRAGFPDLASELDIVSNELKAGKDKGKVLRDMSERCGVQDVTSFVTVLIQSQQFGTPLGDALRVYSSEMRDKRVMRAEEAANKLPTKMTLATMMLTVPPLLIILIGPSVHQIATNFGGG